MLSGYLGAGKTTLLSYLLKHEELKDKKVAVLVNEFGQLPIDGALLPEGDYYLSEINKGSIFCICVKTDLLKNLEAIARDIKPDILLIEATGIAEPRDITALLSTGFLKDTYSESAIITLVDALNFAKLATILPVLSAQVRSADIILLNKIDAVDAEFADNTECEVRKLNSTAEIHRTVNAEFPFNQNTLFENAEKAVKFAKSGLTLCSAPPEDVKNCELRSDKTCDRKTFYDILDAHRHNILRGKGIVDFGTDKKYVEVVNGTVFSRPASSINFDCEFRTAMSFVLKGMNPNDFLRKFQNLLK